MLLFTHLFSLCRFTSQSIRLTSFYGQQQSKDLQTTTKSSRLRNKPTFKSTDRTPVIHSRTMDGADSHISEINHNHLSLKVKKEVQNPILSQFKIWRHMIYISIFLTPPLKHFSNARTFQFFGPNTWKWYQSCNNTVERWVSVLSEDMNTVMFDK